MVLLLFIVCCFSCFFRFWFILVRAFGFINCKNKWWVLMLEIMFFLVWYCFLLVIFISIVWLFFINICLMVWLVRIFFFWVCINFIKVFVRVLVFFFGLVIFFKCCMVIIIMLELLFFWDGGVLIFEYSLVKGVLICLLLNYLLSIFFGELIIVWIKFNVLVFDLAIVSMDFKFF